MKQKGVYKDMRYRLRLWYYQHVDHWANLGITILMTIIFIAIGITLIWLVIQISRG